MKKLVGFFTVLLVGLFGVHAVYAGTEAAPSVRIAVVDVQKILHDSSEMKKLTQSLESRFKPRQQKIDVAQKALQKQLDQFKKDEAVLNKNDKDAATQKIAKAREALVKEVLAFRQELGAAQSDGMQAILKKLNTAVEKVAKKENDTVVMDLHSVVFAADSTDITAPVLAAFNNG